MRGLDTTLLVERDESIIIFMHVSRHPLLCAPMLRYVCITQRKVMERNVNGECLATHRLFFQLGLNSEEVEENNRCEGDSLYLFLSNKRGFQVETSQTWSVQLRMEQLVTRKIVRPTIQQLSVDVESLHSRN